MSEQMACKELVEVVTDYLEGRLSVVDRVRLEEHLAGCPRCQNYLDQMRQTLAMLGRIPAESIEPSAQNELLDVFRDWKKEKSE